MTLRRFIFYVHLVAGLLSAILLLLLGLTGAVMVFEKEIHYALNAKLFRVSATGEPLGLDALTSALEQAHPGQKVASVNIPAEREIAYTISLRGAGGPLALAVSPYTGREIGSMKEVNPVMARIHQFHTNLLLGPPGKLITGWGAGLLLVLALTGLILWFPRRLYKMTRTDSGRRRNLELHHVLGFYSSVFMFIFGATAVVIHWDEPATELVNRLTGSSAPPLPALKLPAPRSGKLSAAEAKSAAELAVPGARVSFIQGLGTSAVRVAMKFPEDRTPAGRTNLFLDSATGQLQRLQTSRTASLGVRVAQLWNREIHTGDLFGWPTRLLACAASLALPVLAITGPLISWGRFRRRRRREV